MIARLLAFAQLHDRFVRNRFVAQLCHGSALFVSQHVSADENLSLVALNPDPIVRAIADDQRYAIGILTTDRKSLGRVVLIVNRGTAFYERHRHFSGRRLDADWPAMI